MISDDNAQSKDRIISDYHEENTQVLENMSIVKIGIIEMSGGCGISF